MKALNVFLGFVLATGIALAQNEQTLIDADIDNGGYGGPILALTNVTGHVGFLTGGGGAWVIDHTVLIGAAGYGLVSEIETDRVGEEGAPMLLNLGYGGLYLGYIHRSPDLVHVLGGVLVGGGGVGYRERYYEEITNRNSDAFVVIAPEIGLEVNIATWCRAALTGGYRFVTGVTESDIGLSNSDVAGYTCSLMLKFGSN